MSYTRLTERVNKGQVKFILKDGENPIEKFQNALDRLAELEDKIEQGTIKEEKTCKNVSEMHPVDGFTCSECGISLVDYVEERVDEEEYDTTYYEYEIKYCPNCGAKVVEE